MRKIYAFGLIAVAMLTAIAAGCDSSSPAASERTGSVAEMCAQSEEAAHYIAAQSLNSSDVDRVTDEVIASRKYPQLDDKMLASIGSLVILRRGTETPDEIGAGVKNTCLGATSGR